MYKIKEEQGKNPYSTLSFVESVLAALTSLFLLSIGTTDNLASKPLFSLAEPDFNSLKKSLAFSNAKPKANKIIVITKRTSNALTPLETQISIDLVA